jgi:hypothetical protein
VRRTISSSCGSYVLGHGGFAQSLTAATSNGEWACGRGFCGALAPARVSRVGFPHPSISRGFLPQARVVLPCCRSTKGRRRHPPARLMSFDRRVR